MKKILVINTRYRDFGGEDANIKDELDLLSKKYETYYLEFDNRNQLNINDIFSFIFGTNPKSNSLLKEAISNFNPDLVYIHNLWFRGQLGIFKILKKNNIKVVHKIHNFRYYCTSSFLNYKHYLKEKKCPMCGQEKQKHKLFNYYFYNSKLKSFAIILFSKRYLSILKKNKINILVLNEFHKNKLINFGVEEKKISIYYNPIKLNTKHNYEYSPNSNYIIYAGRLEKAKGLFQLVEAWKKINIKNLKLIIIGSGPLEEQLKKNYQNNNIVFLGLLTNIETKKYIKGARAVITTTTLFEGHPRLLAEASSYGVPSIYPSFGGMEEYFPKNYELTFKQFNELDLLEKLNKLQNLDLLKTLSREVIQFMEEKFNVETMIKMFENGVSK